MSGPNDGFDISGTSILQLIGDAVGKVAEFLLHELEIARLKAEAEANAVAEIAPGPSVPIVKPFRRGLVVPLKAHERVLRMLYLAQQVKIDSIDSYVRKDGAPQVCPDIYYLLKDHNGGKNPTAPDPADRWSKPGSAFVNRTCDCIGGMSWCGGWDRYQPIRFKHIYDGWINTDSMCMECDRVTKGIDLDDPPPCFRRLDYPAPGCYVVCRSGTPGHKVGHISGVIEVVAGLDLTLRESWKRIKVVDVANRSPSRANAITTAIGWYGTGAYFVEPVMQP